MTNEEPKKEEANVIVVQAGESLKKSKKAEAKAPKEAEAKAEDTKKVAEVKKAKKTAEAKK